MTDSLRPPWSIDQLLPHAGRAILLDAVDMFTGRSLSAHLTIRRDSPFFRDGGIPTHVAIEYMAQACAAFVGVEAMLAGVPPRIGLLLGARGFRAVRPRFVEGERLTVESNLVFRDEQVGVFDCDVRSGEEVPVMARLTVFQPANAEALLAGQLGDGDG
ncbi:3-hydroxylacyl-ACP dehydratase [Reyranella sp. CPCC 100927]|uniref:ApeP family dehydratase n=1 Tax=Reyranella sp. CPCC 100927 TaxID=2599616 RepID=UPI0011B6049E|nr:3-hydroxylacyl-ACP dehydratase [Reyranella sp. CPCC 100927]TWT13689.1 3-hydroxylacyl-ACP dehydratase [Reyranella sp. CPCC 100927]